MAKQTVNIGITPNDGTGDGLRTGITKVNENFTELYSGVFEELTLSTNAGIQFATGLANPIHSEALLFYDDAEKALTFYNNESAVAHNIGLEMFVRAVNKTGITITDGQAVYISGAQGNRPTIALAQSNVGTTASVVGIATHNILNNAEGFITTSGEVHNYNTSGFIAGDKLYISPAVAGTLTNIEPLNPNFIIHIATALDSTTNGTILVKNAFTDSTGTMVIKEVHASSLLHAHGEFGLWNPAGNYEYEFIRSAIVADREVTLPLLTGNDTFVFEDYSQTLSNKTLSSSGTIEATDFKLSTLNTAPLSASDTGTTGEIRVTTDYIYVCTATNTWKRTALTTW
jgi:hypothetical protein